VLGKVLKGIDEDILEYLVSMISEDPSMDVETMVETMGPFLESCEFIDDCEKATPYCEKIVAGLKSGGVDMDTNKDAAPKKLETMVSIADSMEQMTTTGMEDLAKGRQKGNTIIEYKEESEMVDERKERRMDKEDAKRAQAKVKKFEQVKLQMAELERELELARVSAVRLRNRMGAHKGAIEAQPFVLPNPGGGADLLEDATFTLVRGKKYGLIGRNGKGKSTLLRWLAARRVGDFPANLSVHYVTQEVQLRPDQEWMTPADVVIDADIERRLLLQERDELRADIKGDDAEAGVEAGQRLGSVMEKLEAIGADRYDLLLYLLYCSISFTALCAHSLGAPGVRHVWCIGITRCSSVLAAIFSSVLAAVFRASVRASELLVHLGFTPELRARKMRALSGGWRVRVALAAAIFARPDVLLLDEPTNHLSIQAVLWLANELKNSEVWKVGGCILALLSQHYSRFRSRSLTLSHSLALTL
jgi:ATP-binding cassette subfamily F protein 3